MTLQLADRSLKYPCGVAENVLVKVDKFFFLLDFVVMDIEEDKDIPLILGRPFMKTAKVLIDVDLGELKVRVAGEEVTFDVFNPKKHPEDKCFMMDVNDEVLAPDPTLHTDVKSLEGQHCEEKCGKTVSMHMPTLHTDVKSQEVRKIDEVRLKEFPPPIGDGKPRMMKSDVKNNGGAPTPSENHPKPPWPNGGGSFKKHFGGGCNFEGKKTSFLSCFKPP